MASPTPPTTQAGLIPRADDTEQRLDFKIAVILAAGLGLAGVDYISDSSAHTGNWLIFHAIEDTVISSITYKTGTNTGSLAGKTIKAGDRIYGNIVSLTLTSGSGELYRSPVG